MDMYIFTTFTALYGLNVSQVESVAYRPRPANPSPDTAVLGFLGGHEDDWFYLELLFLVLLLWGGGDWCLIFDLFLVF